MSTMDDTVSLLSDALDHLLGDHCDLQRVRRIEAGEPAQALWQVVLDGGHADALVPAGQGGAGLGLEAALAIALACGRHALPLPLPQTLVVRAALCAQGLPVPQGPITIAGTAHWTDEGAVRARDVPCAATAQWVLLGTAEADWLLPLAGAHLLHRMQGAGGADVHWPALPDGALYWPRREDGQGAPVDWRASGAALTAGLMAGAMERVAAMTIRHANERVQFGKPIGRQQAVQHQISVLAEEAAAARTAAAIGLSAAPGGDWRVDPLRAAVAKARASEAVVSVATIAHAVHGAIGISAECDLQMLTRRLHEWRAQYGSESHWNARVGAALLADQRSSARFIQQRIAPLPAATS